MLWLIIAVLIIIADQAVKYLVVSGMNVGDTAFSILNLFDITYIQNNHLITTFFILYLGDY